VFAAVGSAVGLGNVWRFPTVVGRNGGGAFVLVYLLIIAVIGVPMLITESVLGKRSQRGVGSAFKQIIRGTRWQFGGTLSLAASLVILSFYSVIAGWILIYLVGSLSGGWVSGDVAQLESQFARVSAHPVLPVLAQAVFIAITAAVVAGGVRRGIERANLFIMPGIFVISAVLLVRSVSLPGATEGIRWFLLPDASKLSLRVVLEALGQVFFSFSLGMGAIVTYGSYLSRDENIPAGAAWIAAADLSVALVAGFIVIPSLFAFGIEPGTGPGLIFVSLPAVFSTLPASALWASLFFTMLSLAAISSAVSMLEVWVSFLVEEKRFARSAAALVGSAAVFLLGIPSALAQGVLSGFVIFGRNFLDLADYVSSNLLLPLSGLLTVLFVGWVWGARNAVREIETNHRFRERRAWMFLIRYVVPLAIAYVLITGLL